MKEIADYDDPVWEYLLATKITPYIPAVREWWKHVQDIEVTSTGVFPITGSDVPPGLMYRVTNTPVRSPIKHIQVFPFVPTSYLQIVGVAGGAVRMVSRVCEKKLVIEEFTIIEKSNLPSTYHQGQFIAFVPTDYLEGIRTLGKWVYLTAQEMAAIAQNKITPSIVGKMIKQI